MLSSQIAAIKSSSLILILETITEKISEKIKMWCDDLKLDLVLSSGGTGFGIRDNTPETVRPLLHREAPGVAQALISEGGSCDSMRISNCPTCSLSRLIMSIFELTDCVSCCLSICSGLKHTPLAALSRPVVGTRHSTLICTLPGRHV